ncbi:unnamed protein product [Arabidopsis halleri]
MLWRDRDCRRRWTRTRRIYLPNVNNGFFKRECKGLCFDFDHDCGYDGVNAEHSLAVACSKQVPCHSYCSSHQEQERVQHSSGLLIVC